MSAIHVACAARIDYVPHSAAMLHSVLAQHAGDVVEVHYLCGGDLTDRDRAKLTELVEGGGGRISFLRVDAIRVEGLRTRSFLPASHWYRIFLPELLPDLERLIYLDADLIARRPLSELWSTDLDDNHVAAVTNVFQRHEMIRAADLGLPGLDAYFNSGVMLMDLERLRQDDLASAVLTYARANHDRLAWPEQDALNVVIGSSRVPLHPRWNCMNSVLNFPWSVDTFGRATVAEAERDPAIRHFEGPGANKPWHYLCDVPMRDLYFEHRRETPWPDVEVEGKTLGNAARLGMRRLAGWVRPTP